MSNEPGVLNRRSFLKGLIALGTVAALPGGLLTSRCALAQPPIPFNPKTYKIYRNACPRNCYDTCSLKTWVKDDVITFVEGAPESTFTHGTPCVKGLSYPRRVYSPDRIKYPMVQDVRGSGNWRRISWVTPRVLPEPLAGQPVSMPRTTIWVICGVTTRKIL